MKNVTITVEDSALEWARIEAAKKNTSVSRMVGEMLADKMRHNDAYERAMHEWMTKDITWKSDGSPYPSREETYKRGNDQPT